MGRGSIYIIIEVSHRLALQDIAIIDEHYPTGLLRAPLVHKRTDTCQTAILWALANEIVREVASVYVGSFYQIHYHLIGLLCGIGHKYICSCPQCH